VQYAVLAGCIYGGRLRIFDEFMDSKNETATWFPNINNEGGVARTLAIKRTYLSRSLIMKYIFSRKIRVIRAPLISIIGCV
jgi:hypothetical protein